MATSMYSSDNSKIQNNNSLPSSSGPVVDVTVHPLVLLSVADHYHRVARGTRKRVVGVLLGEVIRGRVDVTNSFAVPFEEDAKVPAIYYLDHNYLENMLHMFRKINSKERVVGFYSTGPEIRPNDMMIYELMKRFLPRGAATPPVFVIIDVRPNRPSMPMTAYRVAEDVEDESIINSSSSAASQLKRTFAHVPSLMGAMEAEEVGVEHLLRDINDPTISTVASLIRAKASGLSTLVDKLKEIQDYLQSILDNKITKVNQEIMSNLQTILNLLPNLNNEDMIRALIMKTNDMHMVIYLSSLIRSVTAMHDLINNKIRYHETNTEDASKVERKSSTEPTQEEEKKEDDKGNEDMEK